MFHVPLSSHRALHLQTEKTHLNHSVHLHAASVGCFRMKINMRVEAGELRWQAERAGSVVEKQQRRMRGEMGTHHKTSLGQRQVSGALSTGKRRCKGHLLLSQITALHTEVGKGHLERDLHLVPHCTARIAPGLSSSQGCVGHLLTRPQNHRPSPCSSFITFTHEEVKFKEQNERGRAPSDIFSSSFSAVIAHNETQTFGGYYLKCKLQQKASATSRLPTFFILAKRWLPCWGWGAGAFEAQGFGLSGK